MDKVIFHVDVNSAFLSWEACYRISILGEKTDLRDIPSAVGGNVKLRHGIILAKSIPAKRCGVRTGDTIDDALKLCPNLVTVAPHYDLYDKCSDAFIEILKQYSPAVEKYSIDEAYMDMTGAISLFGSPIAAAHLIKNRIRDDLGFTVNIGISSNKLLAKMAGDFTKPDKVHTLFPEEVECKMWPLPVGDLLFVGHATRKKLFTLGIMTIGDLAHTDLNIIKAHFGKIGEVLFAFANGVDISIVENEAPANKGYGNSSVIPFDVDRADIASMVLLSLSETVCTRLRADNVMAGVVAISVVDFNFHHASHQMTLFESTNITNKIHAAACQLFEEMWDGVTPVRNLGIHTSRIVPTTAEYQMDMFDMERHEKLSTMDYTTDKIRERYGKDSLMRAVFIGNKIYHMSGGISKDKKKPVYGGGIIE